MILRAVFFSAMLVLATSAQAQTLKIQLGSDMARIMYATESLGQNFGRLEVEGGYLYADSNSVNSSDYLLHLGAQVRGESLDVPLIVAIGARAYYGEASNYNVAGLGISGEALLMPDSWNGFGIGAFVFISPKVVSFQDGEGLDEYGLTLNFQITSQATVVAGIQKIEADIENVGTRTIDDSAFIGIEMRF
jgi:hypothetical protein